MGLTYTTSNMLSQFYFCNCFFTHNIYIQQYNMHFNFFNKSQFFADYGSILPNVGCDTIEQKASLIDLIREEIERRIRIEEDSLKRKSILDKLYKPINESIYSVDEKALDPSFIHIVTAAKEFNKEKVLSLLDIISSDKELFGFPVFDTTFCEKLLAELKHYQESDLPKQRPNSMNKHGVLLDDLGFHDNFSKNLRKTYLDPLGKILFPEYTGNGFDSHKIFSVTYKMKEQADLGFHFDNSEVTLNVCLGDEFSDGDLYFGDFRSIPVPESTCMSVPHKIGYGIFHRGGQLHGTLPITSGERHNLILWLRSSSVRNNMCPMCNTKPKQLMHSVGYGDGFTADMK